MQEKGIQKRLERVHKALGGKDAILNDRLFQDHCHF